MMFDPTVSEFESGAICLKTGLYRFAGYCDRTSTPEPDARHREIWLTVGDLFPAIAEAGKTCFWSRVQTDELRDARACG